MYLYKKKKKKHDFITSHAIYHFYLIMYQHFI